MHNLEVIVPFLIAGLGTCFTGVILDHVQDWRVFTDVDEIFILLPALLGLKGNLQMTLASRFSTHFHMGHVRNIADLLDLTCANISLNQCFSIVISVLATVLSELIHFMITESEPFNIQNALLVMSTALVTSSITSFILDALMIMVVQTSAFYNINPDNVASPTASSLGDMTALTSCAFLADLFHTIRGQPAFYWLTATVILFYMITWPIWIYMAMSNPHTASMLVQRSNWFPLITAMLISCSSGLILKVAVPTSEDIALFSPVISGVGGNVVAVQASRISTSLHRDQDLGVLPEEESACVNPIDMIVSENPNYSVTKLFLLIIIPGQLLFYLFCITVNGRLSVIDYVFTLAYLIAAFIQVFILLYLAFVLSYALWSWKVDPDSCAIPYLTSIGDVTGACLVTIISNVAVPKSGRLR